MPTKDINCIKVMLAEKKRTKQMARRRTGKGSCPNQQVMYKCYPTKLRDAYADSQTFRSAG